MISKDKIVSAQSQIVRLFLKQCTHGAQTSALDDSTAACGQFLGMHATPRAQRGLHGTASALYVLANAASDDAGRIVQRIVNYLENRSTLEDGDEIGFDDTNVIKIAEVLFTLRKVRPGVASTEDISRKFAAILMESRRNGTGWNYCTDAEDSAPEELPTAHAIRALAEYGEPEARSLANDLLTTLTKADVSSAAKTTDIHVHVFSLFVLTFSFPQDPLPDPELKRLFSYLLGRIEPPPFRGHRAKC